jgi:hypothetical protein
MANRYWVGGAGTWDNTDTTHWSASSGGGAGASAPTSVDDVFFNSASNATAYAVTIGLTAVAANCRDISISGPLVGNVTITSAATAVINCYGSWLNAATGVAFASTSGAAINFLAAATGKTITTNGLALGTMALNMNATGGGWTLGSALSTGGTVTVTAGSFSTGGSSYSMSLGALASSNSNVRSINLNASTVSLSGGSNVINFLAPTNLTFNAGTSNITFSNANTSVNGGGQTFYNVTFSQVSLTAIVMTGANTFNNLTFPVKTNTGANNVSFGADITVIGTFTAVASTYNTRVLFTSSVVGATRTITAGAVSLAYVEFRDIVGAGTATWTGTSIGNCLGNTNITFDTPKTVYWNLAGAQAWGATAWATTAAGTPAIANLPLAQDTATFTDSGAALSVSGIFYNLGTIDTSTRTLPVTFGTANLANIYGDVINGSGLVYAITGTWSFLGRSTQTITSAGVAFTQPFAQNTFGGTLRLQDNCTTAGGYTHTYGTLDLNGFDLSVSTFASTNSNVRSIAFGTNKIILTGSGVTIFNTAIVTNFTATGTPQLEATYAGGVGTRGFTVGAAGEANAISINVTAGTDTIAFGTTNGAFKNLTTTGFTGSVGIGNSIIFYGNLDFTGVTAYSGTATLSFFAATGTQDINLGGVTYTGNLAFGTAGTAATYRLTNNVTIDTTRTVTLTSGTLNLNDYLLTTGLFSSSNSNVRTIDFATTGYMVVSGNATTVWNTDTATNFSIVGTSYIAFNYAGSVGTRTVYHGITNGTEANSPNFTLTTGSDTFNVTGSFRKYGTLDFSGFAGTISFGTQTVYGSLSIAPAATVLASGNVMTFGATSGTKTILTNGQVLDFFITFDGVGGTWQLSDHLTVGATKTVTLTNGTLDLDSKFLTTGSFSSSNSNIRSIIFGSSNGISVYGSGTTAWDTTNTTNLTISFDTGFENISMLSNSDKTFNGGTGAWPYLSQNYTNILTVNGSGSFTGLFYNALEPTTILLEGGTSRYIGNLALLGGPGNFVTLSSTSTTPAIIAQNTDVYVGADSIDAGNNSNIYFLNNSSNYLIVSYITGHVVTTFPATCTEASVATDTPTPTCVYNVSTTDPLTAVDATASNFLWNLIDDTQDANWQNINT